MSEPEQQAHRTAVLSPPTLAAMGTELVGTFILVFFGAGTVVALELSGSPSPALSALAIGLAFGLAVMICVYAFLHVSGAHINPTVTLGLAVVGKFPWRNVPGYLLAQLVGSIAAASMLWVIFGGGARDEPLLLGTTAPGDRGWIVAFVTEVVLGALLLIVLLATAVDQRATPAGAGLAIGFTIGVGVMVALNVSGGSFNAARTLGPMIVAGGFPSWWVYLVAPALGGIVGALIYDKLLRPGNQPS